MALLRVHARRRITKPFVCSLLGIMRPRAWTWRIPRIAICAGARRPGAMLRVQTARSSDGVRGEEVHASNPPLGRFVSASLGLRDAASFHVHARPSAGSSRLLDAWHGPVDGCVQCWKAARDARTVRWVGRVIEHQCIETVVRQVRGLAMRHSWTALCEAPRSCVV